jgi:hypothetical protein
MTQNNNNTSTAAPAVADATPAVQPAVVQPVKDDAAKVETVEKK